MSRFPNPLAVALDVDTLGRAEGLASALAASVGFLKVGLELFTAHGPEAIRAVGAHAPVFADLKLHDIPTTVERAARQLGRLGVGMLTVHASGGSEMVRAACVGARHGAAEAGAPRPLVIAVTVLTSLGDGDLAELGMPGSEDLVERLARAALDSGADGVVCAPRDVRGLRSRVGSEPVVVTPGIRPAASARDDHASASTPTQALDDGSDVLVVGRPIVGADDPAAAAQAVIAEIGAGRAHR